MKTADLTDLRKTFDMLVAENADDDTQRAIARFALKCAEMGG